MAVRVYCICPQFLPALAATDRKPLVTRIANFLNPSFSMKIATALLALASFCAVATGGLADIIAPETSLIQHVDPDLTLHGLRIVWDRNRS